MNTNEDFKEIYEKYLRFSIRIARHLVKDQATAEDICQEVFCHLYEVSDRIDLKDEETLKYYIVVSIKNKALDYLKKNYVKREICRAEEEETEAEPSGESLEETILQKEETALKRSVLQKLREKNEMNFEILVKVEYLGISPDDVAREYGLTKKGVNNRILRSKIWLRKEWLFMRED